MAVRVSADTFDIAAALGITNHTRRILLLARFSQAEPQPHARSCAGTPSPLQQRFSQLVRAEVERQPIENLLVNCPCGFDSFRAHHSFQRLAGRLNLHLLIFCQFVHGSLSLSSIGPSTIRTELFSLNRAAKRPIEKVLFTKGLLIHRTAGDSFVTFRPFFRKLGSNQDDGHREPLRTLCR
jgi:hypothetical protein